MATVAGAVLMVTGVGGPAGALLVSFGMDALIQQATTGRVNYAQSLVSGDFGGAGFVTSKALFLGRAGMFMTNAKNVDKITDVENFGSRAKNLNAVEQAARAKQIQDR